MIGCSKAPEAPKAEAKAEAKKEAKAEGKKEAPAEGKEAAAEPAKAEPAAAAAEPAKAEAPAAAPAAPAALAKDPEGLTKDFVALLATGTPDDFLRFVPTKEELKALMEAATYSTPEAKAKRMADFDAAFGRLQDTMKRGVKDILKAGKAAGIDWAKATVVKVDKKESKDLFYNLTRNDLMIEVADGDKKITLEMYMALPTERGLLLFTGPRASK